MAKYIVHKAVSLDKVKKARQAVLSEPGYLEKNYIAQPKYDGCNVIAIMSHDCDGVRSVEFRSRTNETVHSMEHVGMALLTFPGLPDGAYLGEAWCPDATFPEISGWFRKQSTTENTARLQMAVFDYLTVDEWDSCKSEVAYGNRVARLPDQFGLIPQGGAPIWNAGSFGHIAEVWPNTTAQDVCNKLVAAGGYDGLILRDPYGHWYGLDSGTNGEIIKVKAIESYDLEVIGYEPGKGKHEGKIGTLIVDFRGRAQGAGTGLKDSERSIEEFHENWNGKIVEIECLGVTEDGMLREPRLKGVRHDKVGADS